MPAGVSAWTPLASTIISGSPGSVTFSSLNQSFRDLVLVVRGGLTVDGQCFLRLNGITTSSYSYVTMGNSSGGNSTSASTQGFFLVPHNYNLISGYTNNLFVFQIFDYAQTDKGKSVLIRGSYPNTASGSVADSATGWQTTTSAVTSLTFGGAYSNALRSGTALELYGVSA